MVTPMLLRQRLDHAFMASIRRATVIYGWARSSRGGAGPVTGSNGVAHHRKTVAALRHRERELAQLADMVPSHLWRLTPDGEPIFFNRRMVDFLGLDVADTNRPGLTRLAAMIEATVHPDDAAAFGDALRRCLATGEPFAMRYRLRRADGAYRWMSSRAEAMRDQAGRIVQWYGLCHDIDDQMQAEEALRQSRQQLEETIDAVPIRIWSAASTGGPVYFNKRYRDHLRAVVPHLVDVDEPRIDTLLQELVHPEDAPDVMRALQNTSATGGTAVMRFRWLEKDGAYRWAECRVEPRRDQNGAIVQWYGVSLDIDDEVRARESLRDRERELSQFVNMVPIYLWRLTPDGEPIFANKRLIDYLGRDIADAHKAGTSRLAAFIDAAVHPDDAAGLSQALHRCLASGERFSMKYRLRRADGVYRWMEGSAEPMRDQGGRIVQWYGLCHDIDDRLLAEDALRRRERELSLLVDMIPSNLWRLTPEGETTLANKHMADFLGMDLEDKSRLEVVFDTIFHPDDAEEVGDVLGRCLVTGERFSMKYRLRRADGVYRWMSGRAEPMRDETGRIVQWFGLCHDIDDQVHAEEALRRASDRLAQATQAASLAELSASIAHEVNQPLAAVVANSHACQRWLSAEPPNLERAKITAERITRDANSAADVVSRIRALFRRTPHARSSEDVNRLIGEVCRLMADEIATKGIRIKTSLEPDLPSLALDRVQVQQVFVNLIRNGIEAMDTVVDGARALQIRSCRDGSDTIRVEVRDAGTGFEDAERVFEPFFTTKPHGMGMGLAICRSIIESHGGRLWTADNEPRGATVAFTLPLRAGEAP
ncbi:PAS domain-containing protein [Inquilinus sp.]|jgi:PAS domain S-box-containing protein|uniref:PAS domain-containing sensor histidine kinase n=1 Tax=Inquilinus sp. TaxID=1932117 RepID=UPI0037835A24